jgi:hypothetical protein
MCFSAAGSFALSGILAGVGAASVARSPSARHRMFAGIPLIFAAQQASEGVVWMTMDAPGHATLNHIAVLVFLGFALVIWPMWLPFSLRLTERDPDRRHVLTAMLALGVIVGVAAAVLIARSTPVSVVAGHSIRYDHSGDSSATVNFIVLLGYAIPTIAPFFVSTAKLGRAIGAMLVFSLVAAALVEREALTSVWCFFAAILSSMVFVAVGQEERAGAAAAHGSLHHVGDR